MVTPRWTLTNQLIFVTGDNPWYCYRIGTEEDIKVVGEDHYSFQKVGGTKCKYEVIFSKKGQYTPNVVCPSARS